MIGQWEMNFPSSCHFEWAVDWMDHDPIYENWPYESCCLSQCGFRHGKDFDDESKSRLDQFFMSNIYQGLRCYPGLSHPKNCCWGPRIQLTSIGIVQFPKRKTWYQSTWNFDTSNWENIILNKIYKSHPVIGYFQQNFHVSRFRS